MNLSIKISNKNGKAFLKLLLLFILIAGIGYVVYNNKDFQRSHKAGITKVNFYLRDYIKQYKDFTKNFDEKIAEWKKSHPPPQRRDSHAEKPLESRIFEEIIFDPVTLDKELPFEMIRHQNDEITVCSFNADFIINNSLTDTEVIHLANVMRFCELSVITNLRNEGSLRRLITALKILRYNAVFQTIAADTAGTAGKTSYVYLYRNDKVQPLGKSKLYTGSIPLAVVPSFGLFKAGDFDFVVAAFATPAAGTPIESIAPLEDFFEAIKTDYPDTQDVILFGNFAFESRGLIWDSASLLPAIARTLPTDKTSLNLLGNFWFQKSTLTEFNGKSGVIDLNLQAFPSTNKPSLPVDKPIWAQFKLMPDDD